MANKEMEVVKGLDLNRYMGRWYEIASFPSRNQPKNGTDTRATYTSRDDGTVHVLNETWTDGKKGSIEGTAYKADPSSDEAKLKVKFYVPPFLPIIPVVRDYWVLYLDEDYQTHKRNRLASSSMAEQQIEIVATEISEIEAIEAAQIDV
ncbi:hypothetical protein RHGRI_000328 [Rhododendron griersonianum]|uniref:Lipocalin/cytosolic fatty-acid binding domain-containing protein n=1 Tax=Rhododendron griersonianum TaxID=479676 RepID=A0AAV6LH38_9ERIC|nr:hypothetical protein RHGRI_000328 [Rhododendron griersonianum]